MVAQTSASSLYTVALTEEERSQLLRLLEQTDRKKLIEIHRTDALEYKQYVEHQEEVLEALIEKVRGT